MDLPCDQEVGLDAYVAAVVDAIGDRRGEIVLVAQSLAGLVAPLVCDKVPVDMMVLVAAMVPRPGESGGAWWANTGQAEAVAAEHLPDDSEETLFTHDVPAEVLAAEGPPRNQTSTLFEEPWPLAAWPDVPTRFLLCRDDRFFPAGLAARARAGPPRHRADRDPRRALRLPQPAPGARPRPRPMLGGAVDRISRGSPLASRSDRGCRGWPARRSRAGPGRCRPPARSGRCSTSRSTR